MGHMHVGLWLEPLVYTLEVVSVPGPVLMSLVRTYNHFSNALLMTCSDTIYVLIKAPLQLKLVNMHATELHHAHLHQLMS